MQEVGESLTKDILTNKSEFQNFHTAVEAKIQRSLYDNFFRAKKGGLIFN